MTGTLKERQQRQRGIPIDGDRLNHEMAARALHADELARLAGVGEDTVSRARKGQRIDPGSLRKLTDALLRVPTNPLMSELARKERTAAGRSSAAVERGEASTAAPEEVSRGRGEPL